MLIRLSLIKKMMEIEKEIRAKEKLAKENGYINLHAHINYHITYTNPVGATRYDEMGNKTFSPVTATSYY